MNQLALPSAIPSRLSLHNEVHTRPASSINLPALIIYVAVINEGVTCEQELDHLRKLPGQDALSAESIRGNFLRIGGDKFSVTWERHSEFSRYSIVHPLPIGLAESDLTATVDLCEGLQVTPRWIEQIPGQTLMAMLLVMIGGDIDDTSSCVTSAQEWLGSGPAVVSVIGASAHSLVASNLKVSEDGFERMLVISKRDTPNDRPGRIAQRLLDIETYRLMALRGLAVAKEIAMPLTLLEQELATTTSKLVHNSDSDQVLLDSLVSQASSVERFIATHSYRFSASRAYDALVRQRIAELKERNVPGYQLLGEFLQRRVAPAMATVASTSTRLNALSERVSRTSALLRTRVDIAAEMQNQLLLEKLSKGQSLQLHLQATVEGLSVAAISYYIVSLILHLSHALHSVGLLADPELVAGISIPIVVVSVWRISKRVHNKFFDEH